MVAMPFSLPDLSFQKAGTALSWSLLCPQHLAEHIPHGKEFLFMYVVSPSNVYLSSPQDTDLTMGWYFGVSREVRYTLPLRLTRIHKPVSDQNCPCILTCKCDALLTASLLQPMVQEAAEGPGDVWLRGGINRPVFLLTIFQLPEHFCKMWWWKFSTFRSFLTKVEKNRHIHGLLRT